MVQAREAHVAGQHHCQNESIRWHDPGLPLHFQRFLHQLLEPEFLQQRAHREQSSVGGQILAVEVIWRGRPNSIGCRRYLLRALFYGGFVAILFSVCNHLGDLHGVGFAKRPLRNFCFTPKFTGSPNGTLSFRTHTASRMAHRSGFTFNPKMNRSLVFDLATCAFIGRREDALFLGPGGTGKSHLAQAVGQAAIQQNYRVIYRETHVLLEELAEAVLEGKRKPFMETVATVPLLIIDDLGMRKLPLTAAEDLLEIIMRRYERASTLLTSNRPVEDWGKLLGDVAAVTAMLDRILHHGHVLKCGPRSWRTKTAATATPGQP